LLVVGRILVRRRRATSVLQERHAAEPRLGLAVLFRTSLRTIVLLITATVAIGLRLVGLTRLLLTTAALLRLLLRQRLAVLANAVAPALIVALDQATHRLDQAIIVVGILPIGFRLDAIAGSGGLACQCLILVEDLMGITPHPDIGPAAIENLVSIGRTIRIVRMMLLVVLVTTAATAATTTTTATT